MRPPARERTGGRTAATSGAMAAALTAATVPCRYDGGGHGNGVGSDNRSGGRRQEGTPSMHGCKGTNAGAMRTQRA
eukprot:5139107-Pleurochrysis_carterae.AAC.1